MPILKFIGYTGSIFLVGSILIGVVCTPLVLLIGWGGGKDVDAATKRFHWSTIAVKCFELWLYCNLIILGATHYSHGNAWYYWPSVILGSMLLIFFRVDCIRNAERTVLEKAKSQWGDIRFAQAEVKAGPMPRLWRHELVANAVAFCYLYIAASFDSLTAIPWLRNVVSSIIDFLTSHTLVAVGFYLVGWLGVLKYMFGIFLGLGLMVSLVRGSVKHAAKE